MQQSTDIQMNIKTLRIYFSNLLTAVVFLLTALYNYSIAQSDGQADVLFSIPEVALVDIEPSGFDIQLSLAAQSKAGLPVESVVSSENNSLWINYTSSLSTRSNTRSVSVQITNGKVPAGIILVLKASPDAGNGQGTTGIPVGEVYVSSSPQTIISGIGRCYTGNGPNYGHQLSYSLIISDFSALDYGESSTLQIAYTITDN